MVLFMGSLSTYFRSRQGCALVLLAQSVDYECQARARSCLKQEVSLLFPKVTVCSQV